MKISTQQYAKTLLELTENKTEKEISGIVLRFAEVLQKEGQIKNTAKIIEKFSEVFNAKHGIVEATIITKDKIKDSEIKKVENYIKEKYGAKEIVINNIIDEKIKGGIIIKVGDDIIDASIANQLKKLEKSLSN